MRLTQIKLSGFKSFAEPTTLLLPGHLVGVVGPNGCGKSNLIDAVRWVLGESRASELRGESMQDVIFNGSGQRKPAQRASVELVFDNAQARAGGQWNAFAEIAVRRTLTRDGTSSYFINQHAVRRRDVQDVFLGTGLGPRAYAIIGQGTISRIIESRPEDLRLFLEEAAGVSKYKERRRETEARLRDTRENLTRVEDIVRELDAQLARLAQQAEVAERWRTLHDEAQLRQHQLWFLRHRDAAADEARAAAAAAAEATALEARIAELRAAEARLERLRAEHHAANDALHGAQGVLGEAALAVSRLEERIRYVVQGRERVHARLAEIEAHNRDWDTRAADAAAELGSIDDAIAEAEDDAAQRHAQADGAAVALPAAEALLREARGRAERQRSDVAQARQRIELLAAEGRHLDEQQRRSAARRERLQAERQTLRPVDAARLQALREHDAQATDAAAQAAAQATGTAARRDALRALQARVQSGGKLAPWLQRQGLERLPGLWTRLHVEPGWEAAFEAALRERLHALAVGRLDTVRGFAADVPPARLAFYEAGDAATTEAVPAAAAAASAAAAHGLPPLAARLRSADAALLRLLHGWLAGCHAADSLDAALAVRAGLGGGDTVFTREGHAVSARSVAFYAPDAEQAGMLARAQEIEQLDGQWQAQQQQVDRTRAEAARAEAAHAELVEQLQRLRRDAAAAQTQAHAVHVEWLRLSQQAASDEQRHGQLLGELDDVDAHERDLQARRDDAQARFDDLDQALAVAQQAQAGDDDAVTAAEHGLARQREQQRELERAAQEARFQARALSARRDELRRALDTAAQQRAANDDAARQLHDEAASFDDAAAEAGLQSALARRLDAEGALAQARSRYDGLVAELRQGDEARLSIERGLEPQRERITQLQLALQAARLGGEQFAEQLDAAGVDRVALARGIDEGRVRLAGLQGEIDRLRAAIEGLGAVNLAALEELESGRERGDFLRAQDADLRDAIATLEAAIQAIDAETRGLLAQTFEQVNDHFGRLFPRLFGGGNARLVMTGAELLDAGVQVMAQPPGKKNSTIHLLSGGEKALTAIALVFAIFQLNPAPFCLLDEVDAPLDDANTERYRALVEQMSEGTQFLFISHNKIAMEMAGQLIGVTMQEQGVSRIVAVDLGEAIGLTDDDRAAARRGRADDAALRRPDGPAVRRRPDVPAASPTDGATPPRADAPAALPATASAPAPAGPATVA